MLSDAAYMERALVLAGRARGRTTPNPLVGAVVVSPAGVVVGTGFHARAGEPHAEVHALHAAGSAARGATLYCTLEPCSHHGRTPPCADRILDAGIARVVAAVADPNPRVAGGGLRRLRDAGVRVDVGIGRDEAVRLNRPFFSAMQRGRPFVVLKAATSLDGRVAVAAGMSTHISSGPADRRSQLLRAEVDAVAVGIGTVLVDDPRLTARDVYRARPLARVVFDRRLRMPPSARLLSTTSAGPVFVVTTTAALAEHRSGARALEAAGATVIALDSGDVAAALTTLVGHDIHSLLVEGGPTLQGAFWREGVVDAIRLIVAPRALGPAGVPWLGIPDLPTSALTRVDVGPCGPDIIMEADVYRTC
ncbi:MAG: bifunctional diaminohydroxyphosphoribosylaminopyrimidine deaminase/5-amino-6-(5-phosphoribosylamino)uracil reductase RibD [Acidobacteria bacterium]|nr:bifunctional diaminohydroxyphosphoribosylaminopyrimidine deaminase/5-amino-6-(5-phosphoribosylamino)uracil reductase RibD [Acidobacteriota bacterium]